jgi:hypothetical protein
VATNGPIYVTVAGSDGSALVLDEIYVMWGAAPLANRSGDYRNGQKGSIVELFGWPYPDVAAECANLVRELRAGLRACAPFATGARNYRRSVTHTHACPTLANVHVCAVSAHSTLHLHSRTRPMLQAAYGYLGAKLWPVTETVASWETFQNVVNPWFFYYQPVSYRLQGRGGNSSVLAATINTCRSLGVRMYADAVVNHMSGGGSDSNPDHRNGQGSSCTEWGAKNSTAMLWFNSSTDPRGITFYSTQDFAFTPNANTGLPPSQEFASVPYGPTDFHCERALNSWNDPLDLNAGWLEGLVDLNTEVPYVQQRIADYMTSLVSIGFSGFRMDAAKHIQPDDHVAIFNNFKANMGGVLPEDWHVWMEVLTGGEGDMLVCNNASGYNYGGYLVRPCGYARWG